jgi:hypothetical protein
LQQLLNDVLHVLANVTGLSQGRCVCDRERHVQQPRKGLRQQRLAAAGGTNQQNVALGDLDFIILLVA